MRLALLALLCLAGAASADFVEPTPPPDTGFQLLDVERPGPMFSPRDLPPTPLWPVALAMLAGLALAVYIRCNWDEDQKRGPADAGRG